MKLRVAMRAGVLLAVVITVLSAVGACLAVYLNNNVPYIVVASAPATLLDRHIVQLGPWLIAGIVGAILLLLVAIVLVRRRSTNRSSRILRSRPSGPDNLNYVCAGCNGQFPHSRRTVAAWEKGTRRFYCNLCHKKWRNQQLPPNTPPSVRVPAQSRQSLPSSACAYTATSARVQPVAASRAGRSGCFTVIVLAILIPVGVLLVAIYA